MSSFFHQKLHQKLLDTGRLCWYILGCRCPLFVGEPGKSHQIRKGKNYVRSSSEYYTADLRRNRFRNRWIRHLRVRKRFRKHISRRIRLRRSEDRPLSPKRNPKSDRLGDRQPTLRGPWLCLCPSKDLFCFPLVIAADIFSRPSAG